MMRSLALRLVAGGLVAIALSLGFVRLSLESLFSDYVAGRYAQEMQAVVDAVASGMAVENGRLVLLREPVDPRFANPLGGRHWQVTPDAEGEAPLRSRSLWDTVMQLQPGPHGFSRAAGPDGAPILVFSRHLSLDDEAATRAFTIHAGFAEAELTAALADFRGRLLLMLAATAAALAIGVLLLATFGLRPLNILRRKVSAVRSGTANRIEDQGPAEVTPLIGELNQLLAEREQAVERARSRASDLAHGLKTPLTVLGHLCAQLPEHERELALEQVELIRQRAGRQLQAARMGVERMAQAPVAVLVGRLVKVLAPVSDERGIVWRLQIDERLTLVMDPADLAEALGNLLDNAVKWTQALIRVSARQEGTDIVIEIADDGPGVAASDRARILRRGGHLGHPQSETGLGLAISADIAEAYGGGLTLHDAPEGGLLARLHLPQAGSRQVPKPPA